MATSTMAASQQVTQPILIELDEQSWEEKVDRIARWLDNVQMIQGSMHTLAQDVRDKIHEPHLKSLIAEVADKAGQHEQQALQLYEFIGRPPTRLRHAAGKVLGRMRIGWADVVGMAGGAAPPFRDLHQLLIASLNASSAFATAEQLGLAMGIKDLAETCYRIVAEKHAHHLLLQEITLESAATAILYQAELAEPQKGGGASPAKNVGRNEQIVRLTTGLLAGAAALNSSRRTPLTRMLLFGTAIAGIGTGVSRYCPMNSMLGIDNAREQAL